MRGFRSARRSSPSILIAVCVLVGVAACSGSDSQESSTPEKSTVGSSAAAGSSMPTDSRQPLTSDPVDSTSGGDCNYFDRRVDPPLESAEGALTVSPFDLATIRMFVNGVEGNGMDSRFSYVLIAENDATIPIYAPAPMLLVKMRLKDGFSQQRTRESGDWDLTFLVSCDLQIRINHVTEPDARILAAYGFGDSPGTYWTETGEMVEDESMMVPTAPVVLEAGDLVGYTQGTESSNFDFVIGIDDNSVCPWEQFSEPVRTELLARLGPPPASPDAGPVPGWPCTGYGGRM